MADFRKLLLALIAGALMFGTVASAVDFSCRVSGVPAIVRSEGIADLAGDILMDCDGTLPPLAEGVGLTADIRVSFLGQPVIITSKLLDVGRQISEATLILDNAMKFVPARTGFLGLLFPAHYSTTDRAPKGYISVSSILQPFMDGTQNVYQAIRLGDQELEWQGVTLIGPGSTFTDRSIRMTNIRINAGLPVGSIITAHVIIHASSSLPIYGGTTVEVANVRQGLTVAHAGDILKNCDLLPNGELAWTTTFTEGYGTSFKPQLNTFDGVSSAAGHYIPGAGYFDESGYNPVGFAVGPGQINGGALSGGVLFAMPKIGLATQDTQFSVTVTGIPSGITLAFGDITTTNAMEVDSLSLGTNVGGTQTLTWKVTGYGGTGAAQYLPDVVQVEVLGSYSAPPVIGIATAHGRFVPDGSTKLVAALDTVAAVPRFWDSSTSPDAAVITITQSCKTMLLFPYVTSTAGYDTGIAITNSTVDPFGAAVVAGQVQFPTPAYPLTKPQAGACTLYFYGHSNSIALTAAQQAQTIAEVPAGGQFVTILSMGANGKVTNNALAPTVGTITAACATCPAMPAFVGYMIANCNFQLAHGFAFITDTGSDRTMGYLALVIPDRGTGTSRRNPASGRLPQDSSLSNGTRSGYNQGEQLGN